MKKTLLTLQLLLISVWVFAQPHKGDGPIPKERRDKIESMKVAFLTKRLSITSDEAKVFWPVYNQMSDELYQLREKRRTEMRQLRDDADNLSDKDYERIFDSDLAFRQAELDILKKYQPQLKKVLPLKKLAKLPRAEEDFKHELLERIKENRGKGSGQSGGNKGRN